jgi:hypothetical protein
MDVMVVSQGLGQRSIGQKKAFFKALFLPRRILMRINAIRSSGSIDTGSRRLSQSELLLHMRMTIII